MFSYVIALFKTVVWALIFLTKLRFPPRVSIAIVLKDERSIEPWPPKDILRDW